MIVRSDHQERKEKKQRMKKRKGIQTVQINGLSN